MTVSSKASGPVGPTARREKIFRASALAFAVLLSVVILVNKDRFTDLAGYGYLGIFLISVLGNSTIVVPAPVILTAFVGGSLFNPFVVGVLTAAGATVGEMVGFVAGIGGKVFVKENKSYKKIEGWVHKNGFLTIFTLAVIPNPLFDLAGIASGVTGYPMRKFVAATFLGKSVKFLAFALLGARLT